MATKNNPIQKSDISVDDPFALIKESAKNTLIQVAALKKDLEVILPITKQLFEGKTSTLADLQAQEKALKRLNEETEKSFKLVKQKQSAEDAIAKARVKEIQLDQAREKNIDRYNIALEKQTRLNERANTLWSKVIDKISRTANAYKELALKKELGGKLSAKEERDLARLEAKYLKYEKSIRAVNEKMGRYQHSVGDYGKAFNGLSFSMAQITREAPAFANSLSTGFMAISNNIPMFVDEIKKIQIVNANLAKEGKATTSVFKQVTSSIFSFNTLLSVGVTLLTIYGAKFVEWLSKVISGKNAFNELVEAQKNFNKVQSELTENVAKEANAFDVLIARLKSTNQGSKERQEIITELNTQYGTTLQNMSDEVEFQAQLNMELGRYLAFKDAEFKIKKNADWIDQRRNKRLQAEIEFQKRKREFEEFSAKNQLQDPSLFGADEAQAISKNNEVFNRMAASVRDAKQEVQKYDDEIEKFGKRIQDLTVFADAFGFKDPNKKTRAVRDPKENKYKDIDAEFARRRKEILESLDPIRKEESDLFDLETWRYEQKIALEEKLQGKERSQEIIDTLKGDLIIHERSVELKREYVRLVNIEIEQLHELKNLNEDAFDIKEMEKINSLEKERGKTIADYVVAEKEIALLEANKKGNKRAIINAEKELIQAKKDQIDAQLEVDKFNAEGNLAKIQLLEREAELAKKKLDASTKEIDKQKELAKLTNEVLQITKDYIESVLQAQIKALDDQISRVNNSYTQLQERAAKGNLLAQESIKEQMRLEQELIDLRTKKANQLALVGALASAGNSFLGGGGGGASLGALLGSIQGFETGTEGTIGESIKANLKGVGKDDTLVRVHGKERVINESLSNMIQGHKTSDVIKGFVEYERMKAYPMGMVYDMSETNAILKEKLEPQQSYDFIGLANGVASIVKEERFGNSKLRKIHKIKAR